MNGVYAQAGVFVSEGSSGPGTTVTNVDPTVNDDATQGYIQGWHWINEAAGPPRVFILVDNTPGAANWDQVNAPSGTGITYGEQYTYSDTTNKVVGPLNNDPVPVGGLSLFPEEGLPQMYTKDYTVREVAGGSAPGYYICVSPTSSAPGGGAFVGGANPSGGIDTILSSGDEVRVIYPA